MLYSRESWHCITLTVCLEAQKVYFVQASARQAAHLDLVALWHDDINIKYQVPGSVLRRPTDSFCYEQRGQDRTGQDTYINKKNEQQQRQAEINRAVRTRTPDVDNMILSV